MIPLQMAFRDKHPVTRIAFSPDQGTVAVSQPHCGVTLLDRGTGQTRAVCPMPKRDALTGLAFTGDGQLLVAASAKGLSVFDATSGAWIANSTRGPNNELMLASAPGGLIGVCGDGRYRDWTTTTLTDGSFDHLWPLGRPVGELLAVCPAGAVAVGFQRPGRPTLFDLVDKRVLSSLERPEPAPAMTPRSLPDASFCPLGRRFALSDGRTLDVYDTAELADDGAEYEDQHTDTPLVQRAPVVNQTTTAVAPAPHAVLAPVFSLRSEKPSVSEWRPPFALLPNGRGLLVKRPRNRVQLWDAPAGALVNEWSWRLEWVTCLAVSPDGLTAVAGGRFGRVLLWDLD